MAAAATAIEEPITRWQVETILAMHVVHTADGTFES